ncbi:MAG: glycosyltransferase family 2 protein [Sphingobacteriales bacterium]|nr:glycosyltransferase family 2 protein [Sphingobacteriales bacterium]
MEWLKKCLWSLRQSEYPCHIICIDNRSTDNTVSFIKNNFPDITLIEAEKNLGFGQANNIGLQLALQANAQHVFLLNQDAWINNDTIAILVKAQTNNPEWGIISPIHLNGSGDKMDIYFQQYLIQSDIEHPTNYDTLSFPGKNTIINTKFVNAAAWLISSNCINKVGGFDPIFFHYGEDTNYVQRVLNIGFKIGIHTGCSIYHDRENRILNTSYNLKKQLEKDWVFFLTQACDIQQSNFKTFITKRFLRHSFLILKNTVKFNTIGIQYHFNMATKILFSFPQISKSRHITTTTSCPHLY